MMCSPSTSFNLKYARLLAEISIKKAKIFKNLKPQNCLQNVIKSTFLKMTREVTKNTKSWKMKAERRLNYTKFYY